LRYIWIILNAAVWTSFFGLLGIFASLFETNKGKTLGYCARLWGKFILFFTGVRYSVKGLENLDPKNCYIFACNHASGYDVPLAFAGLPYWLISVAKIELESVFILGWVMKTAGHIFVDRKKSENAIAALEISKASLIKNPRSILLFPEGTRTMNGKLGLFKRGGLMLSIDTGIPIVPVGIVGTFEMLKKGTWSFKNQPLEIRIGNPINPKKISNNNRNSLAKYVKSQVNVLLDQE
tara:strand:- start:84 stop:791 length:708 start_codon:yes stop_codon:yes gene_type:complete